MGENKIKKLGMLLLIAIFQKLPIKKNKVLMLSYYGKGYDCNPKYLTEYLLKHQEEYPWDIVWVFNDIKKHAHLKGIRKVRMMSWKYFYERCTAKVIITNYRMTKDFNKRKNQYYIQTWHSSLRLKQIEKDAEKALPLKYIKMAQKDASQCDLLISGCKFSSKIFKRAFWYTGEILECGTPRNDYLIRKEEREIKRIKEKLQVVEEQKIILYAPTFRKNHDVELYQFDYEKLLHIAKEKWGGEWCLFIRLHPHLDPKALHIEWSYQIRNLSSWEDIQELLIATDVLISDYSSLIFDYRLTRRPCFLYVPDLEDYVAHDRALYFDIEKLPFEIAKDEKQLQLMMEQYDKSVYEKKLAGFERQLGSFEDGKACERLAKHIAEVINE